MKWKSANKDQKQIKNIIGPAFQQSYDSPTKEPIVPKIFDINLERGTTSPVMMHNKYTPNKSPKTSKMGLDSDSNNNEVFKLKQKSKRR